MFKFLKRDDPIYGVKFGILNGIFVAFLSIITPLKYSFSIILVNFLMSVVAFWIFHLIVLQYDRSDFWQMNIKSLRFSLKIIYIFMISWIVILTNYKILKILSFIM